MPKRSYRFEVKLLHDGVKELCNGAIGRHGSVSAEARQLDCWIFLEDPWLKQGGCSVE